MKPVLSMLFALDSSLDLSLCMMPPLGSLCWPSFTPHQTFFFTFFMLFRLSAKFFDSMWLAGEEGGRVGIGDCQWVYKCHSIKVESTTRCAHHHVPALLSVRRTWMCLDTRREPSALCKSFMCLHVCVNVWVCVCWPCSLALCRPGWLYVQRKLVCVLCLPCHSHWVGGFFGRQLFCRVCLCVCECVLRVFSKLIYVVFATCLPKVQVECVVFTNCYPCVLVLLLVLVSLGVSRKAEQTADSLLSQSK